MWGEHADNALFEALHMFEKFRVPIMEVLVTKHNADFNALGARGTPWNRQGLLTAAFHAKKLDAVEFLLSQPKLNAAAYDGSGFRCALEVCLGKACTFPSTVLETLVNHKSMSDEQIRKYYHLMQLNRLAGRLANPNILARGAWKVMDAKIVSFMLISIRKITILQNTVLICSL